MKKYIPYLVIFLIGALAGMWAHRQYHFRDARKMPQNDTIVRFDTIRYSRLELTTNSLPYCNVAHVTKIDRSYEADAFFPNLDMDPAWKITAESDEQVYFDTTYAFVKYERKNK